jgi:hypothetical protein
LKKAQSNTKQEAMMFTTNGLSSTPNSSLQARPSAPPESNIASCGSSNSGSSDGYRHNPYDCEHTKVFYPYPSHQQSQDTGLSSNNSSAYQSPSNFAAHQYPQHRRVDYSHDSNYDQSAQTQQYHGGSGAHNYYNQSYDQSDNEQQREPSFEQQRHQAALPVYTRQPPQYTLHTQLCGRMNFALYPKVAFESLEPTLPKHQLVRMFIGQLPYNVTEMQLAWILYTFGAGANMYHFERITKTDHSKGGIKVPTGCFHCHLEAEQVAPLLKFLNDRLLVDDTGIWVTDTAEERSLLARYCHGMKLDKTRRFQGRPYGTVVAQVATSTFDPDTFTPGKFAGSFRRQQ